MPVPRRDMQFRRVFRRSVLDSARTSMPQGASVWVQYDALHQPGEDDFFQLNLLVIFLASFPNSLICSRPAVLQYLNPGWSCSRNWCAVLASISLSRDAEMNNIMLVGTHLAR